jgi:hypothetical protein
MEKRYQVFVSSTYADLKDERQRVIQTLMEMDCIPSGMELFPAADEDQFAFIMKVIDDCDYYLLVVGGRYGSTTEEGVSYTEKEYDYAISRGLKVVAFLHEDPDSIAAGKTDKDPDLAKRLQAFREKVQEGRLVRYWKAATELPGLVALSLSKTIKTYPAIGWIRGSATDSSALLAEINDLRKENSDLRSKLAALSTQSRPRIENIADLNDTILVHCEYKPGHQQTWRDWSKRLSWGKIFGLIAPYLLEHPSDALVQRTLRRVILNDAGIEFFDSKINDHDFQTIKIQLKSYGLVELVYSSTTKGGTALFWNLTKMGEEVMLQLRSIRKDA